MTPANTFVEGDNLAVLPTLGEPADVIYIDSGPLVCPAGFYYSSPFVSLIVSDIR